MSQCTLSYLHPVKNIGPECFSQRKTTKKRKASDNPNCIIITNASKDCDALKRPPRMIHDEVKPKCVPVIIYYVVLDIINN